MRSHTQLKAEASGLARLHGFTLIEMLVVISFGSSIMLTAVGLVHTAFKLQSQTQTRLEQASILDRYVEQFRRDANLADRVELLSDTSLKLFLEGEKRVEYNADENQITRRAFAGEGLQQVAQVRLEPKCAARFAQVDSGRCVVLDILGREVDQSAGALSTLRQIVVAVGKMDGALEEQR